MKWGCVHRATYSVRDRAAHARNHDNTTALTKPNHLFRSGLCRHESARNVDFKHGVRVFGRIVQRWRLLLDAGRGDKAIEAAMRGGDLLDDAVQMLDLTNVDAAVVQLRVELRDGAFLDAGEVFAGFGWEKG